MAAAVTTVENNVSFVEVKAPRVEVQGKYVIIFIFGTALAAAVFAWTFQYMRGRHILELWGVDNARLIRVEGKSVTLLELADDPREANNEEEALSQETFEIDGQEFFVEESRDVSEVRGLIHARQALIEDGSFQWDQPRGDCQAQWQYVLQFADGDRTATVLFDTHCRRARLWKTDREAAITPKVFDGWLKFLSEQLETPDDDSISDTKDQAEAEDSDPNDHE